MAENKEKDPTPREPRALKWPDAVVDPRVAHGRMLLDTYYVVMQVAHECGCGDLWESIESLAGMMFKQGQTEARETLLADMRSLKEQGRV